MRHGFFFTSAALAVSSMLGCSDSTGSGDNPAGTGANNGAGEGSSGQGGAGASSGSPSGQGTGAFLGGIPQGTAGGSSTDGGANCAALVLQPEAIVEEKMIPMDLNCTAAVPEPIAIYIVLDNSGSMDDNHKWPDAVDAITMFVQSDPTALGAPWTCVDKSGKMVPAPASLAPPGTGSVSVALQYFHPRGGGGRGQNQNGNECDGTSHRTPAVPMGPLPANGGPIGSSLQNASPNGNTPTVGALTGGTQYCSDYQAANPGKKCVVVLVTDGQPNACGLSSDCGNGGGANGDCVDPNSASVLVPISDGAFKMNGVITFTMGMNGVTADGFNLLDQIAAAGGSDCTPGTPGKETCDITSSGSQGFLDALNTIRKTVQVTSNNTQTVTTTATQRSTLQCEWGIPKPPSGATFHKELVNVSFSRGGMTEKLGNVPSKADCAAARGGWYYDNPTSPTRILACPETCTLVQSAANAKVEVLLGCVTEPATIR